MAEAPYNQTRTGPEGGSDYRTGTTPSAQRLSSVKTNADTGQTSRNFGAFPTNDYATLIRAALEDPSTAAMVLRLAQGQTSRPLGRLADFRDNIRGNAFQTALALAGAPGFGSLEEMAPDFLNQAILGNDLLGYTSGLGNQIAGMDFSGMASADIDKFLKAGLALQGLNMGGLGQRVRQGQLDDLIWDDLVNALGSGKDDNTGFVQALANSPFRQAMSTFGR